MEQYYEQLLNRTQAENSSILSYNPSFTLFTWVLKGHNGLERLALKCKKKKKCPMIFLWVLLFQVVMEFWWADIGFGNNLLLQWYLRQQRERTRVVIWLWVKGSVWVMVVVKGRIGVRLKNLHLSPEQSLPEQISLIQNFTYHGYSVLSLLDWCNSVKRS